MKILVTGGNRGLGKHIVEKMNADSISRSNGHNICSDINKIVNLSLEYDVFINNAFSGDFSQTELYYKMFDAWKIAGKTGQIINIGSSGNKSIAGVSNGEFYRVTKAALEHASKQGTHSFRKNDVPFKTSLINFDRLDSELSRSRPTWTGNGVSMDDIVNIIEIILKGMHNTCIEEVTFACNFFMKS